MEGKTQAIEVFGPYKMQAWVEKMKAEKILRDEYDAKIFKKKNRNE